MQKKLINIWSRVLGTSRRWLSQKNESTKPAGKPNTFCDGQDQMHAHIGICSKFNI